MDLHVEMAREIHSWRHKRGSGSVSFGQGETEIDNIQLEQNSS